MKRSIIVGILVLCLLFSTVVVFATAAPTVEVIYKETQTFSEYDYIKSIQAKTNEELMDMGYEEGDIVEIRKIDLKKYAEELKKSTPDMLREQGYSEEIVNAIQQATTLEEVMSETMGNVTYSVTAESLTYSNDITKLRARITWNWSSKPIVTLFDTVALTTNKDFYRDDASAYNVTTVYYYKNGDLNNTPAKYNNKIVQKTEEAGTLVYSEIPMRVTYPSSTSGEDVHYAMRGTMEVQMKESGPIYTTNVAGNYGHMIISCTPSVEINDKKQLSISFLPEICIESGDEATDSIDL